MSFQYWLTAQVSAALSIFDQIFFMNFSQPQVRTACSFPQFFHLQTGRNTSERNPDPLFYLYAIYSFIQYWPFYIQVLKATCEPRLNSLLRFRTAFRSCPLFY